MIHLDLRARVSVDDLYDLIVSDIFWVSGLVFVFGLLASFVPALAASLKDPVKALNN